MIQTYEFHVYSATPDGDVSKDPIRVEEVPCFDVGTARTIGRKLARAQQGPVDVARKGPTPWSDRYVGTASPRYPYTGSTATVFERLD